MANIINGDSGATSGSAGVKIGSDGSNALAIQTNNVTAISIDGLQNANFVSTGAITLTSGTTAQRPTAVNGMIRYNTSNNVVEAYSNSAWTNLTLPVVTPAQVSDQNNTSTGYFSIPIGTTAQRPAGPSLGAMRWNSNTSSMEVFIGSSTWANVASSTTPSYTVQYLAVAGGAGAGSNYAGSGGGGGGLLAAQTTVVPGTAYSITIGAGGAGAVASAGLGANGSNTTFGSLAIAVGGGGGSGYGYPNGYPGGSGGGGPTLNGAPDTYNPGGSGTAGQGFAGGSGIRVSGTPSSMMAAGGGGAGGVGGNGQAVAYGTSGAGGPGLLSTISGSANFYAGGGGGGGCAYNPYYSGNNVGGQGGGGSGTFGGIGVAGTANTGGGGGGGGNDAGNTQYASGAGGSGIVIISYSGTQRGNGGSVTYTGAVTIHTFTTSGTYTA